jgi:hypothetical protein
MVPRLCLATLVTLMWNCIVSDMTYVNISDKQFQARIFSDMLFIQKWMSAIGDMIDNYIKNQ